MTSDFEYDEPKSSPQLSEASLTLEAIRLTHKSSMNDTLGDAAEVPMDNSLGTRDSTPHESSAHSEE